MAEKNLKYSINREEGENPAEALARSMLNPVAAAATTRAYFDTYAAEHLDDLSTLVKQLESTVSETLGDDRLPKAQEMLAAQASALDGIFHHLAWRASRNMGEYLGAFETYLKLALRAQSQCRATLEVLNEIKNPKLANVVRQANIAGGHQQVNNGIGSCAGEIEKQPNELLETDERERLDFGTAKEPVRDHSEVEAVGEVDGTQKRGGKK